MKLKLWWAAGTVFTAGMVAWGGEVDLRKLGEWNSGFKTTVHSLAVDGDRLFVCHDSAGLFILDVADPTHPTLLGKYKCPDGALGVTVDGNTAYVGSGTAGLLVLDVSNPAIPKKLGGMDTTDMAFRSHLRGQTLYQADRESGLWIFDVSNPAQPVKLGQASVGDWVWDVKVAGSYAFLAGNRGLWVVDVTQSSLPVVLTNLTTSAQSYRALAMLDGALYAGGYGGGVHAFDVRNPSPQNLVDTAFKIAISPIFSVAASDELVVVGAETEGAFLVLDRAAPLALKQVAWTPDRFLSVAVAVSGRRVFAADANGLVTVSSAEPSPMPSVRRLGFGRSESRTLAGVHEGVAYSVRPGKLISWLEADGSNLVSYATNPAPFASSVFSPVMMITNQLGVMAGGASELATYDLTDPNRPVSLGSVALGWNGNAMAMEGKLAVVAGSGLSVVDLADPALPRISATVTTGKQYVGVAMAGRHIYVGSRVLLAAPEPAVLQVFALGESNQLALVSEQVASGPVYGLVVQGDRLCAIHGKPAGLSVYALANPAEPLLLGQFTNDVSYTQMVLVGDYLYAHCERQGVEVFDVRDPRNIRRVGGNSLPIQALVTDGTLLYANSSTELYFFQPLVPPLESRLTPLGVMEGRFRFLLEGEAGQSLEVQRAARLGDWLPWQSLTLETNKLAVEDVLNAEQAAGFYRVLRR